MSLWALKWRSVNRLDGVSEHIIRGKDCLPRLFKTRREAREFAETEYGLFAHVRIFGANHMAGRCRSQSKSTLSKYRASPKRIR
jgi:hypothetical protein